jgi:hypothetical protein
MLFTYSVSRGVLALDAALQQMAKVVFGPKVFNLCAS